MREIEVKIAIDDADGARSLLGRSGAVARTPRYFEDNRVYDDERGTLRSKNMLLRLRSVGARHVLTFKSRPADVPEDAPYKILDEHETEISDPGQLDAILGGLGLRLRFRYQKYRQRYRLDGQGIELDETPMGTFLELEGSPEWIERTARVLGISSDQFITKNYREIQEERMGEGAGDLVFPESASG
jgi:adenylate cyclase class 2